MDSTFNHVFIQLIKQMKSLLCMSPSAVLPQLPVLGMEGAVLESKHFPRGQKVQLWHVTNPALLWAPSRNDPSAGRGLLDIMALCNPSHQLWAHLWHVGGHVSLPRGDGNAAVLHPSLLTATLQAVTRAQQHCHSGDVHFVFQNFLS